MGCCNGGQGLVAEKRQALAEEASQPGEHRRPRGIGGTHPGRSSCVRNAVTPVGVRAIVPGKPTARKAQLPGGNLMIEKHNAGSRKTTGNRSMMAGPFSRPFRITGRIRDASARTRKGADAVR
jgi:hypothetical protein